MNRRAAKPHNSPDERADTLDASTARGMADAAAGRVVPHSTVREWLLKLARGERTPRPRPR